MSRSVDLPIREALSVAIRQRDKDRDLKLPHGVLLAFGCRVMPLRYISRRSSRCLDRFSQDRLIEWPSKVVFRWDFSHGSCAALLTCSSST
jgi:hypothetical protein